MPIPKATKSQDSSGDKAIETCATQATFYTHPLSKGSSSAHYGGNAQTYVHVGLALDEEMVKQLKK